MVGDACRRFARCRLENDACLLAEDPGLIYCQGCVLGCRGAEAPDCEQTCATSAKKPELALIAPDIGVLNAKIADDKHLDLLLGLSSLDKIADAAGIDKDEKPDAKTPTGAGGAGPAPVTKLTVGAYVLSFDEKNRLSSIDIQLAQLKDPILFGDKEIKANAGAAAVTGLLEDCKQVDEVTSCMNGAAAYVPGAKASLRLSWRGEAAENVVEAAPFAQLLQAALDKKTDKVGDALTASAREAVGEDASVVLTSLRAEFGDKVNVDNFRYVFDGDADKGTLRYWPIGTKANSRVLAVAREDGTWRLDEF